jgi:uncharacterized protein (TIGR03545 family)
MIKIIRLWGLAVFIVVAVLLIGIWMIFSDLWVKRSIEISVGSALNTELNIGQADLSLSPFRIELNDLEIADRAVEYQNRYEIDSVKFDFDASELLRRKIIINSVNMRNIRFHTERDRIPAGEQITRPKRFTLPSIDLPNVKEIIESEEIISVELAKELSFQIREDINRLQNEMSDLPDQTDLEQHQEKAEKLIEKIKTDGISAILTRSNEIIDLRKGINSDINEIEKVYTESVNLHTKIKKDKEYLQNQIREDINRTGNKYRGVENLSVSVSSLIFSEKVHDKIVHALFWYHKFEPFINRAVKRLKNGVELIDKKSDYGTYILYREIDPKPDLYIKSANISMYHSLGYLTGQLLNFSSDQSISRRPTTLKIGGDDLETAEKVRLTGIFDRISHDSTADTIAINISGLIINKLKSQLDKDLSLTLTNANADIDGKIIHNGKILSGNIDAKFLNTHWDVRGIDGSKIISELQRTLDEISAFQLKIAISGNIDSIKIQITSDLDSVLNEILMERINTTLTQFEKDIQKEIEIKLDDWFSESDLNIKELNMLQDVLLSRISDHRDVLKQILF